MGVRSLHLSPVEFVRQPEALQHAFSLDEALEYTRWLATNHYENFHVVSFLLPRHLHQDFYNVYSFCRWADDLGDEIGDTAESLRLLGWWRSELTALFDHRQATNPVYVALRATIDRHRLPPEPFHDLITAFEQDQTITRYRNWEELYGYCRNSANPVGRLVLYLCGYRDPERQRLSDFTCTALQLANFWQDVTVDLQKDRIYLPLHLFEKHGYTEAELRAGTCNTAFTAVMRDAVDEAQRLFEAGLPLPGMLDRRLALDIDLFSRGGLRVLDKIREQDYNVLRRRPAIGKTERVALLLRSLARVALRGAA